MTIYVRSSESFPKVRANLIKNSFLCRSGRLHDPSLDEWLQRLRSELLHPDEVHLDEARLSLQILRLSGEFSNLFVAIHQRIFLYSNFF